MTAFVFIGCGTAVTFGTGFSNPYITTNDPAERILSIIQVTGSWGVTTALAFGLGIAACIFSVAHISGGALNPAVSIALFVTGNQGPIQAIANICAQIVGAILAAAFIKGMVPDEVTSNLGANNIAKGVGVGNAFIGEAVMTFVLLMVVLFTAVNQYSPIKSMAPLAIGLAVYSAHAVLLPVDGCSINPARSLGPAIVSGDFDSGKFWVYVVGPITGALVASAFHLFFETDMDTINIVRSGSQTMIDTLKEENPEDAAADADAAAAASDKHV